MPEQMTTDEINRYIHEQILEKCVHDRNYLGHVKYGTTDEFTSMHDLQSHGKYACHKCPDVSYNGGNDNGKCPDYCSDDSPRRLLEEVIAKIEPLVVIRHPASCGRSELESAQRLVNKMFNSLNLTAEQIARAIVELHKQETTDA